jgi:hypothetical protein
VKLDINEIMIKMSKLENKFLEECKNVDVKHPDVECDTFFILAFVQAYWYWKMYNDTINGNPECKYFKADGILRMLETELRTNMSLYID